MTILDQEVTVQSKEEKVQSRQPSQENGNRKQRTRQGHNMRDRPACQHRSEQVANEKDFGYWNNGTIAQRTSRTEVARCEGNASRPQLQRDDITNRGHLKPRGLSKSSSVPNSNEDLLTDLNNLGKKEINSMLDAGCVQHPGVTKVPHATELNTPASSHSTKILGRSSKKSGDKKVVHHKRKHKRNMPYSNIGKAMKHQLKHGQTFRLKSPQVPVEECTLHAPKENQKQYQSGTLVADDGLYRNADKVGHYSRFSSTSDFMCNVSGHHDQFSNRPAIPNTSRSNSNPLDENCTNLNHSSYEDKSGESDMNETKHNSDDEYDQSRLQSLHHGIDFKELEERFEENLKKVRGFVIKPMVEDGACLFRAVADQVYGDQSMHDEARKNCMNYMTKNADFYSNYVTEDFKSYIDRKRDLHTYGNHLEMQAMAELYNRPFEVYQYSTEPINTFQASHLSANPPIRVSYHQNSHYNAVIDPYKATIGVGLGLPSFKPGLVDSSMLKSAMKASSEVWEQQMLNDKVQATDWETTDDAILEQVARESYMEYIEQKSSSKIKELKTKHSDIKQSPPHNSFTAKEVSSPTTLLPKVVVKEFPKKASRPTNHSGGDWVAEDEEWEVLSQVLANSQQEYMDVLKQQAHSKATCSKYT